MVTLLSWAVPVANTPTKPIDLHQAMMPSENPLQQQQQQQLDPRDHTIPRRGGGIRGQSKLLVNLPETVLANTNHSSSRTMHGPPAKLQAQVGANEWDPEDPEEQEDLRDETEGKVSNRWIDDTKELVRKVDASMHALIEEGVFGRERTESDPVRIDGTGDSSSDNLAHVPQGLDEVHVVGGLSDSLDGSRSESWHEKEQPGGPDEKSSSQDERDKVNMIGGREPLHEKEQPGGPDEEESSSQDERDKMHVIGGLSNNLDGSRSESLQEKEQPGGPDEESPLQDTAEADAPEKVEYRPGGPADGKPKGNNEPHGDKIHSPRDGDSDAKQDIEMPHENLLPALEMPAIAQQKATYRERIATQEKTSPLHETSAVEESPGRR
jgi:hypothetical protein